MISNMMGIASQLLKLRHTHTSTETLPLEILAVQYKPYTKYLGTKQLVSESLGKLYIRYVLNVMKYEI